MSAIHMSFFTEDMVFSIIKREMLYDNIWFRYVLFHEEKSPFNSYYEKIMVKNDFNDIVTGIMNQYIY